MSEWKAVALSEIADIRISNVDKKSIAGEKTVLLCNYMDVYSNEYITRDLAFMEATASVVQVEKFRVAEGDVIITKDSETPYDIGIPAVVIDAIENLVCGYHLAVIKPMPIVVDSIFLSKQLAKDETARYFSRYAAGSTRYGLSNRAIAQVTVELPSLRRQRKIARILQTIDQAIEKTEALIDKYQQIKAGLMHDLFTRGIAADGQLRPPREQAPELYQETPLGWIPKEWELTTLMGVMDFLDGQRVPLKESDRAKMQGEIPYYGASGIIDYIDRWIFNDELILLGEDGENILSRNLPLAFKVEGKCWVNNHAHVLKPKNEQDIDFWTEALEWRDYTVIVSGSAQPKLNQRQLSRMLVAAPPSREQMELAKVLSGAADKIQREENYRNILLQKKSGLMHDLLTGKVPVQVDPKAEPEAANV